MYYLAKPLEWNQSDRGNFRALKTSQKIRNTKTKLSIQFQKFKKRGKKNLKEVKRMN